MTAYIARRLIGLAPILLGVSLLVFLMVHITPGDPVQAMMADTPVDAETMEQLRKDLGLDRPLWEQYLSFLGGLLRGDLGTSFRTRRPVAREVAERFPATLQLIGSGTLFAVVLGITSGVIAAANHDSMLDSASMVVAVIGVSMPSFWLGLILIYVFCVYFGWIPVVGGGAFISLLLPAFSLGFQRAAMIARLTRSNLVEVLREDYVRTAQAKGLSRRKVIYKHALKNALIPVVTWIGMQMGAMVAGSVIIEQVFAWPGTGRLLIYSIMERDYPTSQGLIILLSVCFVIANLLVDISYAFLDPRIKYS